MRLRGLLFSTTFSCLAASVGAQERHGDIYALIGAFDEIRRGAAAQTARAGGLGEPLPDANQIEELESRFVHIYDPAGAQPLTKKQSLALAHAIGGAGRQNDPNLAIPAGYTFLGQFVDHDVTLNEMTAVNTAKKLQVQLASANLRNTYGAIAQVLRNGRSSLIDLDSVYGVSLAQLRQFVDSAGSDKICDPDAGAAQGACIDLSTLSKVEARALAAYERDASSRLTGRFAIAHRAAGPKGPIIPDLPRCADSAQLLGSPACQLNIEEDESFADMFQRAVIGDGRNDENVIIAQIHLMFLLAHNKLYDEALENAGVSVDMATPQQKLDAFRDARRTLVDHWQAIVLDDYLTEHLSREEVDALRTGNMVFYTNGDGQPYCTGSPGAMPHEFAVGAFRSGHSQVRPGYALNTRPGGGAGFRDLFGNRAIGASRQVDFRGFFDGVDKHDEIAGDMDTAATMKIDTVISPPLAELGPPSIPKSHIGHPELGDLAKRNNLRAGSEEVEVEPGRVGLEPIPLLSGLQVANELGIDPLTDDEVASLGFDTIPEVQAAFPDGVKASDLPLWPYVLAEAEIRGIVAIDGEDAGGARFGPVGGTIVAETLVGLIRCDAEGILSGGGDFTPSMIPASGLVEDGRYHFADLVDFALGE